MRNWTEHEEQVVLEEAQKNPDNLREAFFFASLKIKRTPSAICTRYYDYILNGGNSKEKQIKQLTDELTRLYDLNLQLKKELNEIRTKGINR